MLPGLQTLLARPMIQPEQLGTDLICYWDARDTARITIATGISSWTDRVANYDMVQATGAAQPALTAGWAVFDGVDDYVRSADAGLLAALPVGATPCEMWVVADQSALVADTGNRRLVAYDSVGGNTDVREILRTVISTVNRCQINVGDGGAKKTEANDTDYSGIHLAHCAVGAAVSEVRANGGSSYAIASVPTTAVARMTIGAANTAVAAGFWSGRIRIVAITKSLPAAAQSGFRNWLMVQRYN